MASSWLSLLFLMFHKFILTEMTKHKNNVLISDTFFSFQESSSNCACHVLILESEYFHAANLVEIIENSGGVPNEKLVELSKRHVKV